MSRYRKDDAAPVRGLVLAVILSIPVWVLFAWAAVTIYQAVVP